MIGSAIYGQDNGGGEASVYRYVLTRDLGEGMLVHPKDLNGAVLLIGLNPSTATAEANDPTITREIGFARSWGHRHLWKCNAFGFRATDPDNMMAAADPVGPFNDKYIFEAAALADRIVICWGNGGAFQKRGEAVLELLLGFQLWHFGKTKIGEPKHPLYLKGTSPLVPW